MPDAESCVSCDVVEGRLRPPGGVLWRGGPFVVHGLAGPSPVRGYVVVSAARHVRGLYDLTDAEAAALGPLLVRIQRAQRAALGADHAYAFVIGDLVRHFHAHVVPRFADAPPHLRGARVLQAGADDARPAEEIEAAARALADALRAP